LKIKFWGTRGSFPVPGKDTLNYGGNTSCVEVRLSDGSVIILDAGTGIHKLGLSLIRENHQKTITLVLTHSHWDHIQGFPFFLPAYAPQTSLCIMGCKPNFNLLKKILINQMEARYFPVNFKDLRSHIEFSSFEDTCVRDNKAKISAIRTNHPAISYGFKIEENNYKVVFLTDNELLQSEGQVTSWEDFVKFSMHADLLIHDSQFTPKELSCRAGWGHSTYDQAVNLALEARVKNLALFHHDPEHSDEDIDDLLASAQNIIEERVSAINCFAAREGEVINLHLKD
jgi:phosphoribosyl 1,2-cyclic phosphodiesterase